MNFADALAGSIKEETGTDMLGKKELLLIQLMLKLHIFDLSKETVQRIHNFKVSHTKVRVANLQITINIKWIGIR